MFNSRTHFPVMEESPEIILSSRSDFTGDTAGISSPLLLSSWLPPPPAVRRGEAWFSLSLFFFIPWILHAVDILIHDSAYSTGGCVPSRQIRSSVSLPVLMEERHLIINWIKGSISGARWVVGLLTKNYLWSALKFPGTNGTKLHHCLYR